MINSVATVSLRNSYGEPTDEVVLRWSRKAAEEEEEEEEEDSKSSSSAAAADGDGTDTDTDNDNDGNGGGGGGQKHERARGDVPVLEAKVPSGRRFVVRLRTGFHETDISRNGFHETVNFRLCSSLSRASFSWQTKPSAAARVETVLIKEKSLAVSRTREVEIHSRGKCCLK
jgi:hypothetical protein